jgi:hypothetical protein
MGYMRELEIMYVSDFEKNKTLKRGILFLSGLINPYF